MILNSSRKGARRVRTFSISFANDGIDEIADNIQTCMENMEATGKWRDELADFYADIDFDNVNLDDLDLEEPNKKRDQFLLEKCIEEIAKPSEIDSWIAQLKQKQDIVRLVKETLAGNNPKLSPAFKGFVDLVTKCVEGIKEEGGLSEDEAIRECVDLVMGSLVKFAPPKGYLDFGGDGGRGGVIFRTIEGTEKVLSQDDGRGRGVIGVQQIEPSFMDNAKGAGDLLIGDDQAILEIANALASRNTVLAAASLTTAAILGKLLIQTVKNARFAALSIVVSPEVIEGMLGKRTYIIPSHEVYTTSDVKELAVQLSKLNSQEARKFIAESIDPELYAYYNVVGQYVLHAQWQAEHCTSSQCL